MDTIRIFLQKLYSKLPVILFDTLAIPIAWSFAYWFRYNLQAFPITDVFFLVIPLFILMLVQVACYYVCRVYRGLWRFSSLNDVARIIRAISYTVLIVIPVFYFTALLPHVPRSVIPLYVMILVLLLCGSRLLFRQYADWRFKKRFPSESLRVIIVGAGQAGESLIRDLRRTNTYAPIGLVDDNAAMRGMEVHGVCVLGTISELPQFVLAHQIDLIFIAIPSAGSQAMRRIVASCEACGVPFHTLPGLQALTSGHVEVNTLRQVNINDLLGRDQVHLNWNKIADNISGMRIIITGGGGSIGSELCRQILTLNPAKLLVLDNSEFNLYHIDLELKNQFPEVAIERALVSITDEASVNYVFKQFKPDIVFHAAAYKHVPLLEEQLCMAVANNVLGTQIIAEASVAVGVTKFILISTDKAVNPTNIMGTTKRIAEIYCQNLNSRVNTQFITVRFGNVLGSMGSVVPLFQKQLQQGGPLTITHPDIERYFMTIPEASQLILQAMVNGSGGEIFVLDMGEPIKIQYLAEQMILLSGKTPGKDIQIQYTGLRPGEKLFEELFHLAEHLEQTTHEKLFKATFRQMDWVELTQSIKLLHRACLAHQIDDAWIILKRLVPEFCCN